MATSTEGDIRESDRSGPYVAVVRWMENLSDTQFAYLLLTPVLLLLGIIAFWPLLSTFRMSLFADSITGSEPLGEFVGLQNYVALLTGQRDVVLVRPFFDPSAPFRSALTVTLIFTVASVFFETLIGFGQALVLDQDFRFRRWVRVAIIIPWAVPIVIQGMIFFLLFQPGIGFLVDWMQALGVFTATPLANPVDSMIIIIVADVWKTSAFMALIILAGLQSVDRSLYDVGKVAGATRWQQFRMITLPLVLPSVLVAMLFRTIGAMRVYGIIETVAGCSTVPSLSCLVVSTFRDSRMYGTSAAVAFITAALIGIVVSVYIVKYADTEGGA
ncbi:carbohydrate ABC transporter permease [Halorussus halophilus]|uniref:carbohydrate ABC transporter permease n=1 Tax=Halorussus halophilus TaxID=2650975 RepID=UPI0013010ABD|nr:sugar ABC transporter permease [Halorussus halophilus]